VAGLTDAEKAIRHKKLTGSTAAACLGLNLQDWGRPSTNWAIQMGLQDGGWSQEAEDGNWFEDAIARASQARLLRGQVPNQKGPADVYRKMTNPTSMLLPGGENWMVVHPDRLFPDACEGMQIKRMAPHMAKKFKSAPGKSPNGHDNDLVPQWYLIQCLVEMHVVRMTFGPEWGVWWLACDFGGSNIRLYRIAYVRKTVELLFRLLHDWWVKHIAGNLAPSDELWLKRRAKDKVLMDLEHIERLDPLTMALPEWK
jgi:hypothetical protein